MFGFEDEGAIPTSVRIYLNLLLSKIIFTIKILVLIINIYHDVAQLKCDTFKYYVFLSKGRTEDK